jgi:hypothetical protein
MRSQNRLHNRHRRTCWRERPARVRPKIYKNLTSLKIFSNLYNKEEMIFEHFGAKKKTIENFRYQ